MDSLFKYEKQKKHIQAESVSVASALDINFLKGLLNFNMSPVAKRQHVA